MNQDNNNAQFEEDDFTQSRGGFMERQVLGSPKKPKMVNWLINKGIVKDESVGVKILIVLAVLFFTLSWFLVFGFPSFNGSQSEEERLRNLSPQVREFYEKNNNINANTR
jgi:hypothetical protein